MGTISQTERTNDPSLSMQIDVNKTVRSGETSRPLAARTAAAVVVLVAGLGLFFFFILCLVHSFLVLKEGLIGEVIYQPAVCFSAVDWVNAEIENVLSLCRNAYVHCGNRTSVNEPLDRIQRP